MDEMNDARAIPLKVYRCRACGARERSPWVPFAWIGITMYRGAPDESGSKVLVFGVACSRECAAAMIARLKGVPDHAPVRGEAVEAV